jgi:hypothetical protein
VGRPRAPLGEPGPGRLTRPVRPETYLFFFVGFALVVFLTHAPFFELPLYWDELGQFIPASLDLYHEGRWVPHSTVPNVHPPGLMAYLAGVWRLFGYSIPATRAAMLLVAAACVFVVFLLAIQLCRGSGGAPAFSAAALVLLSPLFYTQAILAQLDLPALLFTAWALLWFLQGRFAGAAAVSTALVLVKETGIVAPLVFAVWLWRAGKRRQAAYFLLPVAALAGWLGVLWASTGHPLGNSAFTEYNLFYPLHPVRASVALLRRLYYLFAANFHWLGWIAVMLAWRRTRVFSHEAWSVAATLGAAQVLAVSLLGGATLERYLLPVLPLVYIAMAAAWSSLRAGWVRWSRAGTMAGLLACLFINPPYPFPYENNLAMMDFIQLHRTAAEYLERSAAGRTVTTAWPLSAALRRPEYGYVGKRLRVREIPDFGASDLKPLDRLAPELFVLYSKEWDPPVNIWRLPQFRDLQARYYGYERPVTAEDLETRFGLALAAEWSRRGQWIAVFERRTGGGGVPGPVAVLPNPAAAHRLCYQTFSSSRRIVAFVGRTL